MLHLKDTRSSYRDFDNDLQYLADMPNNSASDLELYRALAEYDEMERELEV